MITSLIKPSNWPLLAFLGLLPIAIYFWQQSKRKSAEVVQVNAQLEVATQTIDGYKKSAKAYSDHAKAQRETVENYEKQLEAIAAIENECIDQPIFDFSTDGLPE